MDNIILVDFYPGESWNFEKGLIEATNIEWKRKVNLSNKHRKGFFSNLLRYLKYFFFSFSIFLNRKKYNKIISWQQFYGLIFAFFCRLFNVKKVNDLTIMTFIYKPKKGLIGKLYYKFMRYIVTSKYVDRFIVFSRSESEQYSEDFNVDSNKFTFVPLGEDIINQKEINYEHKNFIFSSGFSNRDFDFLIKVSENLNYQFVIFGDKKYESKNVIMTNEIVGDKLTSILKNCKLVAIPLKENRSAGQLTILHAMEAGVPIIATNTDAIKDYIIDGENGFVCENDEQLWVSRIKLLYENDDLYMKMSQKCSDLYLKNNTQTAMGKNVGMLINKEN